MTSGSGRNPAGQVQPHHLPCSRQNAITDGNINALWPKLNN
jgi:hypothetical protein